MASMTWSRRMRKALAMSCVGRWRLPRCQATRMRWCGSRPRISSSGSGAATTSTSRPSSSTSASPPRNATAFSRSSRNSRPRVPLIAMRRRCRSSKSSTTVSAGVSVKRCCPLTCVARIMRCYLVSTFSGVMTSIFGGAVKHFTATRPNVFMCSWPRCGTSASAFSHCSTNTILLGSVTLSCRS